MSFLNFCWLKVLVLILRGLFSFLIRKFAYTKLWSDIPKWDTPAKMIFSGWLAIIRSISVCAVSEILVGSFMIHFIPYDLKIRRSRLPK